MSIKHLQEWKCDYCDKTEQFFVGDYGGHIGVGWQTYTEHTLGGITNEKHFCCVRCISTFLEEEREKEVK